MPILLELLLLSPPLPDLPERLEATYAVDPAAAEEASRLIAGDPTVLSSPRVLAKEGETAVVFIGRPVPGFDGAPEERCQATVPAGRVVSTSLRFDARAWTTDAGVALDLEVLREQVLASRDRADLGSLSLCSEEVQGVALHRVVAPDRYVAVTEGDLTVMVRAVPSPTEEDLAPRLSVDDELRPRSRRRAFQDLLVDPD